MIERFSRKVTLRVFGLALTIAAGTLAATDGRFVITPVILVALSIAQAIALVHFVERTNRDLARFLAAIRADELGERFEREREGVGFDELGRELSALLARVKALRGKSEVDLRITRAILDQVPVPLLAVGPDGYVERVNHAARRFFGTLHLVRVHDLKPLGDALVSAIETLEAGGQQLIRVGASDRVLVSVSEVRAGAQTRRVFSLQSLRRELDSAEVEAWQALVRVLTHELMNSLTPVRSLASAAAELLDAEDAEAIEDARVALRTVAKRADGLLGFIDGYREIARVPKPERHDLEIEELFIRVQRLFGDAAAQITVSVTPRYLSLRVDGEQIERVLINLVRNAFDAAPDAQVALRAQLDARGRPTLSVSDDGPGVPADVVSKIFVPFFTTKPNGTGVGLALTRQIMRAHGGSVAYETLDPRGARFTLHF